jgi:hypothetical protein
MDLIEIIGLKIGVTGTLYFGQQPVRRRLESTRSVRRIWAGDITSGSGIRHFLTCLASMSIEDRMPTRLWISARNAIGEKGQMVVLAHPLRG